MSGNIQLTPYLQTQALSRIQVFSELSNGDLSAITENCFWKRFYVGKQIVHHEDKSHDVYFICQGRVRVTIYTETGKVVTFQELKEGEMFGELAAIDRNPRVASVEAMEDVVIASLPAEGFRQLMRRHVSVNEATLLRLCSMARFLCARIYEFSTLDVKNRIHAELLRLAKTDSGSCKCAVIDPAPTHADIASRLSTHREAVTRELNELRKLGVIDYQAGRITILDLGRLQEMIDKIRCC